MRQFAMRSFGRDYIGAQAQIGSCFCITHSSRARPDWCTEFFLPVSSSVLQCLLNAANDRLAHSVGIAKTHLALCRVHIYIHSAGVELEEKKRNRVLPCHKTTFDRPAVYEDELLTAGLSAHTCLTDKTTASDFRRGSAVHFDQALQQFDAVQVPDPIAERGGSR